VLLSLPSERAPQQFVYRSLKLEHKRSILLNHVNFGIAAVSVSDATHVRGGILKIEPPGIARLKVSTDEQKWVQLWD
jgi:hypothetical protein